MGRESAVPLQRNSPSMASYWQDKRPLRRGSSVVVNATRAVHPSTRISGVGCFSWRTGMQDQVKLPPPRLRKLIIALGLAVRLHARRHPARPWSRRSLTLTAAGPAVVRHLDRQHDGPSVANRHAVPANLPLKTFRRSMGSSASFSSFITVALAALTLPITSAFGECICMQFRFCHLVGRPPGEYELYLHSATVRSSGYRFTQDTPQAARFEREARSLADDLPVLTP